MKQFLVAALALATFLGLTATAAAHDFDHPAPGFSAGAPVGSGLNSGPFGAWQLIKTFPTGNPHTDVDFFTQRGETYMAAGTLAVGPNGGGQTIVKLTQGGEVTPTSPQFVSAHPSASCLSDPAAALGLQHDVEATPKGNTILNTFNSAAVKRDAQLLIDATDNEGRCHDATVFGLDPNSPQGGLEIIDITDVNRPVEIGMTSHIGEAHTVNVDPKRPHIAYAVTSDTVNVTCNADDTSCTRANENPSSSQRFNLDGFEVIDLSSCMNFGRLTSVIVKRMSCRPQVYRYRYPSALMALGHTADALSGCHELEIYPNDRLTCASINATMHFDVSGAFDSNGRPRGTRLPCRTRPSASPPPYATSPAIGGVVVTDCVFDGSGQELTIPRWRDIGSPSLAGVNFLGSAFHQGRGGPYASPEDVDVSHEAELSGSRRLILTTDERGGGVTPPGATCLTSPADNPQGNGGIHAYRVNALQPTTPSGADPSPAAAQRAWQAYASNPSGGKAIYRARIHTGPQASLCTSHVFHQIPGQNRIFMGWYTQGTQVVDFVERSNGTVEFREAGYFIPENANTWTSAVFKVKRNADGTFTYWGATGDFNLGAAGRSAIDIYKVTLPAPPRPLGQDDGGGGDDTPPGCEDEDDDDNVDFAMAGPATAAQGSTVEYQLTYANLSADDDAECTEIEDELDDDLTFVSASNGGVYDPATHSVTWSPGRLAPGATGTVLLTAQVSPFAGIGSLLVNQASLSEPGMLSVPALAQTLVLP